MDSSSSDWDAIDPLPRAAKTVLVLDLVESVRLMEQDEAGTVHRWQAVQRMVTGLLDQHRGRLVKSLGDGMMLEFRDTQQAAHCARAVQAAMQPLNADTVAERRMTLRAGLHAADVYVDDLDLYGAGVNLAARLATLAGPGEIVVSAAVRDALTDGLDGTLEDLGDCYLKHLSQPVRAFRLHTGCEPVLRLPLNEAVELLPSIAVIPFETLSHDPQDWFIGEVIADGVIGQLGSLRELQVISRLSTKAYRDRRSCAKDIGFQLGAGYVLSGTYVVRGSRLLVLAELAATSTGDVVWTARINSTVDDLLDTQSEVCGTLSQGCVQHLLEREVEAASYQSLPTLRSCSLLLGGISLMHRSGPQDFLRSGDVLDHLVERHQRAPIARAWRAKWFVLKGTRGLSTGVQQDAQMALNHTQRALDANPRHSMALAVEAFVHLHLRNDLDAAHRSVQTSIEADASNSLGWLFAGTIQALRGDTTSAVDSSQRAMALSPLDPLRYYYLCLAGSAALFDGQHGLALDLLHSSLRLNRFHAVTSRILAITYAEMGNVEDGRKYLAMSRALDPGLTVNSYLQRLKAGQAYRQRFAHALAELGLPAG